MSKVDYAAVIIGGGPAGAVTARVLAESGVSVLLADARPAETFQVGESLVPSARVILKKLGAWESFLAGGHLPCYGNASAWGSPRLVDTDFIRSPYGHGWHLDRASFDAMLCRSAEACGATLWNFTRLTAFEREQATWRLALNTPAGAREVTCRWLIDCSGRSYCVAQRLEVRRRYEDRLVAFYARFRAAESAPEDEDSRTLVESVPQGWFHCALLPSRERVVTFFTDADADWVKAAKTGEGFLGLVNETVHVAQKLKAHDYVLAGELKSRDARSSRLDHVQGEGWLAAGDAATAFDPLSSQGILFGLYCGLQAGNALANALKGRAELLDRYESVVLKVYNQFLSDRITYYGQERRWRDSPFWQARAGDSKTPIRF